MNIPCTKHWYRRVLSTSLGAIRILAFYTGPMPWTGNPCSTPRLGMDDSPRCCHTCDTQTSRISASTRGELSICCHFGSTLLPSCCAILGFSMLRGSWAILGEVRTIIIAAIALMQVDARRNAARCQPAIRTAIVTCVSGYEHRGGWPQPRCCHSDIPGRLIPWHENQFPLLSYGYRSDGGTAPGEAHTQEGNAINHPKPMTTMRNLQDAAAAAAEPKARCLTSAKTYCISPSTGYIRGPCHSNYCILSGRHSDRTSSVIPEGGGSLQRFEPSVR